MNDECSCGIRILENPPTAAYRPHTLTRDCWCTASQTEAYRHCTLARRYGLEGEAA